MTAITATAYSRTAPRGAVVAAEVFTWLLNGLRRVLAQASRGPRGEVAGRKLRSAFPA
ncbi:hypothetical protein [Azohydromonas lata]|uniref:Uncharacterized protein n=1 Tax=Azohydromonas lata TaxID=45677 RepID=A0ABU5I7M3_9BURK|nr:hypothetical protein [Azohydromonas lata]MDZ5454973.1 hypothetical protein [Azohydromonas lata]